MSDFEWRIKIFVNEAPVRLDDIPSPAEIRIYMTERQPTTSRPDEVDALLIA